MRSYLQPGKSAAGSQAGYALLAVLLLMIIIGYALGEAGMRWSEARQREREAELLKVGDKIRIAIGQYYQNTPGNVKQFPEKLELLLRDDRFPKPKRYLRELYIDPMIGREGWGILVAPSGGIMGVYSLSAKKPYKAVGFRPIYKEFEKKKMVGDWIFTYLPELQQ